jgi:hypothetical protein
VLVWGRHQLFRMDATQVAFSMIAARRIFLSSSLSSRHTFLHGSVPPIFTSGNRELGLMNLPNLRSNHTLQLFAHPAGDYRRAPARMPSALERDFKQVIVAFLFGHHLVLFL